MTEYNYVVAINGNSLRFYDLPLTPKAGTLAYASLLAHQDIRGQMAGGNDTAYDVYVPFERVEFAMIQRAVATATPPEDANCTE